MRLSVPMSGQQVMLVLPKLPSDEECVLWSSVILPTDQLWAVCANLVPLLVFPANLAYSFLLSGAFACMVLPAAFVLWSFALFHHVGFLKSTTSFQAPVSTWSMPLPQSFGKPKFRQYPKKDFLKLRFLWVNKLCSLGNCYIPKYNRWLHSLLEI